ncbi:DsbA family protein [Novosphingobium mangrovi (ex Huang et al. 2023)]|uniref:DsbA family protein n=1 Tax=Novosphingobium mangrovi (ex Huang et al. 2023) TaxID=2976432 RepID=A0ABT2I198_9SPHN|nr:DsbA family protein [Novosphingobium mangrovi (ex Huang et al. 2023)]MCT2398571.1 DsbA family protein [Novosphingobium mangrovi (ex Huang et al. 2023)]
MKQENRTMKPSLFRMALTGALAFAASLAPVAATAQKSGNEARSAKAQELRERIRTDPLAPTTGARNGDVTVVVFSDYQCPYCRRFNDTLDALVKADPKVRVVYRDWPIQGPASVLAARATIAAQYQNKHAALHAALMAGPVRLDEATIKHAAREAKVDWNRLQTDMKAHKSEIDGLLVRNYQYARIMGLEGTPGLLIGPYLVPGAVDLATLRQTVANARKEGAR